MQASPRAEPTVPAAGPSADPVDAAPTPTPAAAPPADSASPFAGLTEALQVEPDQDEDGWQVATKRKVVAKTRAKGKGPVGKVRSTPQKRQLRSSGISFTAAPGAIGGLTFTTAPPAAVTAGPSEPPQTAE